MKKIFTATLLLSILYSWPTFSSGATIYSAGGHECGEVLEVERKDDRDTILLYQTWLGGYVTATNFLGDFLDSQNATDIDAALSSIWYALINECRADPTQDVYIAAYTAIKSIWDKQ